MAATSEENLGGVVKSTVCTVQLRIVFRSLSQLASEALYRCGDTFAGTDTMTTSTKSAKIREDEEDADDTTSDAVVGSDTAQSYVSTPSRHAPTNTMINFRLSTIIGHKCNFPTGIALSHLNQGITLKFARVLCFGKRVFLQ